MKPVTILVAIISVCLVGSGCGAGEYVEEEVIERSVEFQPGGRLSLVNVNGDISIGTWDRHEVTMKAEKRARAGSEEAARLLLEKTTVEFDRIENRIDIRTEVPEKPRRNRNVSITYTLTVPEEIDLELRSVNGSIQVNGVSGAVDAKTDQRPHRACRNNRGGSGQDHQRQCRSLGGPGTDRGQCDERKHRGGDFRNQRGSA